MNESGSTACPLCGAQGEPLLCYGCQRRAVRHVQAIPSLWAEAHHHLAPSVTGGRTGAPVLGPRSPVNDPVMNWIEGADLFGKLGSWEILVRADRHLAPVGMLPAAGKTRQELDRLCAFLVAHSEWLLTTFTASDEYALEMRDLYTEAINRAGLKKPHAQFKVTCVCTASLTIKNGERVTCYACGNSWLAVDLVWQALDDRNVFTSAWASPRDVAEWCGVDVATIYRWRAGNFIDGLHGYVDLRGAHRRRYGEKSAPQ